MAALAFSDAPPVRKREDFKLAPPGWEWSESDEELEQDVTPAPPTIGRFAKPKSDTELASAIAAATPTRTKRDTNWCMNLWNEWRKQRNITSNVSIPENICELDTPELQLNLQRFVLEVRKKDGSEYPPNSLHHIACGVMRHLRQDGGKRTLDIFQDAAFADFRATLDAEMKRLNQKGVGSKKRQAEPISTTEEEQLWECGVLGDHCPQSLLNSVFYLNGLSFALRSGDKHRQLRLKNSQIQVVESHGERAFLRYTEDASKNNEGGLKSRKIQPKVAIQHANVDNPDRCPVRIYKKYLSLCPGSNPSNAFYLKPLKKPTDDRWYSSVAIGHNVLDSMVRDMCKEAGVVGYKTNHSLRTTTATRLFHAGVDEQLIMERTGHRSTDGVRSYKRTSIEQQQVLSDIVNLGVKRQKTEVSCVESSATASTQETTRPQVILLNCNNITLNFAFGKV